MQKFILLIIAALLSGASYGQVKDSVGMDNNPVLTQQESIFLNRQLKAINKDTFDFVNKKTAFYYSLIGYKEKKDYFADARKYNARGELMQLQLLILDESEKKDTHGYDVIVVAWYRNQIMRDARAEIVKKLKKEGQRD